MATMRRLVVLFSLSIAAGSSFALALPARPQVPLRADASSDTLSTLSTTTTATSSIGILPLPNCRDVQFTVSGTAEQRNFTAVPLDDPAVLRKLVLADEFPRITVKGSQVIGGLFCEPTVQNSNNDRLHFAVAQLAGNRNYWTAQGGSLGVEPFKPENYSWVDHFTAKGYAVLAIDRLGTGMSSKPDPINVVQRPYEVELYHDIVQQIKKNETGALRQSYKDITYVGVSYGSVVGKNLAETHPDDFAAVILQGFTYSIIDAMVGFYKVVPVKASDSDPLRYQNLPDGYMTLSYAPGVSGSYFGNPPGPHTYDAEVADVFFQRQDLIAVGQFISTFLNITKADAYKGRVLVLTGENDQAFCGYGSLLVSEAHCGTKVADTIRLFPNAEYNWYKPDNTGHLPNLFYSAPDSMKTVEMFLDGERIGHNDRAGTSLPLQMDL